MILSDGDILKAIEGGRIGIEPFDPAAVQPSSVDLHVDRFFRTFHNQRHPYIDVKKPMEDLTELVEVDRDEAFILHPGEFVLGSTAEYVKLPEDVVARLEGKSSLGRLGLLIHSSLPGDEEILFLHDGQLQQRTIREVVEKRLEGSVVSFDPAAFRVDYHEVTGWWQGPPDRIFEVALKSGRKVRLTGGHDLFALDSHGRVIRVPIHALSAGTKVALPRRIPDPSVEGTNWLDLIALAPESDYPNLLCRGPTVAAAWEEIPDLPASLVDIGIRHADHYRKRSSLPFEVAHLHGITQRMSLNDFLCFRGSRFQVPARLRVTEEFAWLLGMYVAEGYVRRNQVTISNSKLQILNRVESVFADLGMSTHRSPFAVTCCSAVMARLIYWMGMEGKARHKRLPRSLLTWSRPLLEAFLEGFIDGDGSREATRISLWSGSERLVGDLLVLCERLGKRASASMRVREHGPQWQISLPYGEHKLLTATPLCTELLLELRRDAHLNQKQAAAAAGFRYPTQLNNIEKGRWPAIRRATLKKLRDAYADRGAQCPRLDRLVDGDVCWDDIAEVRDTGRIESVYDLEVRPNGRRIENFVAGFGGIFVSNTAGYVDPGFEGHLTLELSNVANLPITIYPGMKIGQISFFQLTSPAENPYGTKKVGSKYQGQRGPTPSRYFENFED